MLESTFSHVPGIGPKIEHNLWSKGCTVWEDIHSHDYGLSPQTLKLLRAKACESRARLESNDFRYFASCLPHGYQWRAYSHFLDSACFLDIETTGLSAVYDDVTCVCVHSLSDTKTYVLDKNLHDLKGDLKSFSYIVTFNGARFDLPFLSRKLGIVFNQIHLDLFYSLARLGYRGGLKKIEVDLGLCRGSDGVTGYDAVRLWKSYESGREIEVAGKIVAGDTALKMLVDYNIDDTVNLKFLADFVYDKLSALEQNHMCGVK